MARWQVGHTTLTLKAVNLAVKVVNLAVKPMNLAVKATNLAVKVAVKMWLKEDGVEKKRKVWDTPEMVWRKKDR